jgi:hypothetical protein
MTLRVTSLIVTVAAACSQRPSAEPPRPSSAMTLPSLLRIDRATFCTPRTDADGCSVTCTDPPTSWSTSTQRFPRIELWAHQQTCPDSALPPLVACAFAVSTGTEWFVTEDVLCRRAGMRRITGIDVITDTRPQAVVLQYTLRVELPSIDAAPDGVNHVETQHDMSEQWSRVCGARNGVPHCTPAFATAVHDDGGELVRRTWRIDGDMVTIEPLGSDPELASFDKGVVGRFSLDVR